MITIGIDPGRTGAIVGLYPGGKVRDLFVMPHLLELSKYLRELQRVGCHVFLEKARSFRGQGVTSTFNYGVHYGELCGALTVLSISHTLVQPNAWTKVMHLGTRDDEAKARSLEACRRLFPEVNLLASAKCKKPHTGLIDALLIAEYGRRLLVGTMPNLSPGPANNIESV